MYKLTLGEEWLMRFV